MMQTYRRDNNGENHQPGVFAENLAHEPHPGRVFIQKEHHQRL